MNGISKITAMIIASRDDLIFTHSEPEKGKFSGWITMPNGRPLVETRPVFESSELAISHMKELRGQCAETLNQVGLSFP